MLMNKTGVNMYELILSQWPPLRDRLQEVFGDLEN